MNKASQLIDSVIAEGMIRFSSYGPVGGDIERALQQSMLKYRAWDATPDRSLNSFEIQFEDAEEAASMIHVVGSIAERYSYYATVLDDCIKVWKDV